MLRSLHAELSLYKRLPLRDVFVLLMANDEISGLVRFSQFLREQCSSQHWKLQVYSRFDGLILVLTFDDAESG